MKVEVFQILYSESVRPVLDTGFSGPECPDCDAAKIALNRTLNSRYFDVFLALRKRVVEGRMAGASRQ